MSKRFIDTGLFDDEWFMDLSKDAKLLWVYCITKCDHAGIIKINEKLLRVQTEIKDLNETINQLDNRIVRVSKDLTKGLIFFIPKYLEFQYPGFPNSKVRAQVSAVDILTKYGLFDKGMLTLSKDLHKSYVYEHDNDNDNKEKRGVGKKEKKPEKINYSEFVSMLPSDYEKLVTDHGSELTKKFITTLDNYKGSSGKKYKDDYRAILSWVIDKVKVNGTQLNKIRNAKPVEPPKIDDEYDPYAFAKKSALQA